MKEQNSKFIFFFYLRVYLEHILSCRGFLTGRKCYKIKTDKKCPLPPHPSDTRLQPADRALAWWRHQYSLPWALGTMVHIPEITCMLVRFLGLLPQILLETQSCCPAYWQVDSW